MRRLLFALISSGFWALQSNFQVTSFYVKYALNFWCKAHIKFILERFILCSLEWGIEPREATYFSRSALAVSNNAAINALLYMTVDYYFVRRSYSKVFKILRSCYRFRQPSWNVYVKQYQKDHYLYWSSLVLWTHDSRIASLSLFFDESAVVDGRSVVICCLPVVVFDSSVVVTVSETSLWLVCSCLSRVCSRLGLVYRFSNDSCRGVIQIYKETFLLYVIIFSS